MATRAGWTGILTGLLTTLVIYLLSTTWPDLFRFGWPAGASSQAWIAAIVAGALTLGGGGLAGRWSGSARPGRCTVLGLLAGGLSGTLVFCLWGAAMAGLASAAGSGHATNESIRQSPPGEILNVIVRQTMGTFLALFLGGGGLGAVGGWLACPRQRFREDVFDRAAPQMALNAAITAVPAAIVATGLAAAVFSRLADMIAQQAGESAGMLNLVDLPLAVSLLLLLISQLALTLVIPYEARRVEHRCGMDEVKMAAYVGIGAAPALILLLSLVKADCFANPVVSAALLAGAGMSLMSLRVLLKGILPRRATLPAQGEGWQKTEARWFGTIATSHGPRLVVLCVGCGLAMVLPLYISVVSLLINLTQVPAGPDFSQPVSAAARGLFLTQALASSGMVAAAILALTGVYLFYLSLGRWFNQRNARRSN